MHFVRLQHAGAPVYGLLKGDDIHLLKGGLFDPPEEAGETVPADTASYLPPVVPSKVLAVGLNFRSHAGESGASKPELFIKLPSSLIGHDADIVAPPDAENLHFEGELVVVIGKRAKNITEAEVPDHIFGVTVGNDVSERGWQSGDLQWVRAKASDGFGPLGPCIATDVNYRDVLIETKLNGKVMQSESSVHLIHDVDKIVAFASRYITLEQGDVIFCGTPGRTRPMQSGDVVEVSIEGVGTLRNRVTKAG